MVKVVLIDDERPALRELEYLLKADGAFEVAGMFINPLEAIAKINTLNPQAVFLDIHMPQLKGIDAASQILDRCPGAEVIFVTAYDQYAIEAFELHALDYILKPVSEERFAKTLSRIKAGERRSEPPIPGRKFKISCLGEFQAGWEGREPIKWRSEKTKELFAFLLHHAGREVTKEKILGAVWPDVDEARAVHQLHNGIYYIRKTLDQYGVDRVQLTVRGSYLLKLGEAETDLLLFRNCLRAIGRDECSLDMLEKAEALYSGDYLEGTDWRWADLERDLLLKDYIAVVLELAERYFQKQNFNRAETLLLKAFRLNPYVTAVTRLLLKLYQSTADRNKALGHFQKYAKILREELAIEPEADLRALVAALKNIK